MSRRIIGLLFILSIMSCDESFNPVRDYRDQLIVYSLLNTFSDTQYVRVYSTYNPPGHNALNQRSDTPLQNVSVRIDDVSNTWLFADTLLPRPAGSRYAEPVFAYYNDQFRPQRGGLYLLEVTSPIGTATSVVRVPDSTYIFTSQINVLQVPQLSSPSQKIELKAVLAPETYAILMRLFLDYEVAVPGGWAAHEIEIPLTLSRADSIDYLEGKYPALRERTTDPVSNVQDPRPDIVTYTNDVYFSVIRLLRQKYPPGVIRFLRARLELIQTDEDFYTYTKVVSGFADQNSVRTDEPDVTNIIGGRGLFGVIARDTTTYFVGQNLGL